MILNHLGATLWKTLANSGHVIVVVHLSVTQQRITDKSRGNPSNIQSVKQIYLVVISSTNIRKRFSTTSTTMVTKVTLSRGGQVESMQKIKMKALRNRIPNCNKDVGSSSQNVRDPLAL
ncbi:hypothetical protein MKW98_032720, partial [Papaver atlanticum]